MKLSQVHIPGLISLGLLAAIGFILIADGTGMSMFSKLILFSRVDGVITQDGKPVEGAQIIQEVLYKNADEVPATTVVSGPAGDFVLEEVTHAAGVSRMLPGQVSVVQRLVIRFQGKEYEGWRHNKTSVEPDSELDGQPLKLVCELTTPPDFEGTHFGICRAAKE
ncbi:MAG: hypothetical protein MUP90_15235 [Gammaproteobacteria bacterium]|nr:hypothetical protein [Gammaproteobacteria bacterium]